MRSREELIEVMARALAGKGAWHWLDNSDVPMDGCQERELDRQCVTEILTAIESNGAMVVPVEMTEKMLDATELNDGSVFLPWRYTAMLNASPFKKDTTDE